MLSSALDNSSRHRKQSFLEIDISSLTWVISLQPFYLFVSQGKVYWNRQIQFTNLYSMQYYHVWTEQNFSFHKNEWIFCLIFYWGNVICNTYCSFYMYTRYVCAYESEYIYLRYCFIFIYVTTFWLRLNI